MSAKQSKVSRYGYAIIDHGPLCKPTVERVRLERSSFGYENCVKLTATSKKAVLSSQTRSGVNDKGFQYIIEPKDSAARNVFPTKIQAYIELMLRLEAHKKNTKAQIYHLTKEIASTDQHIKDVQQELDEIRITHQRYPTGIR